jgi:geranylgeranyl diphosphate synthase type II
MPKGATPFTEFTDAHRPVIEEALDRFCPVPLVPSVVREAMRYSLLLPGKRLRPLLTLLAAEVAGGSIEKALPAAAAIEMVHVFSLIHDDLPAMDNDDVRRGKPSNHRVFGEGQAILAGDALLARAFEVLAAEIKPTEIAIRCIEELAHAAGPDGMAGGQSEDLRGADVITSVEQLDRLHRGKTAALIVAALRSGAHCAHAHEESLRALTAYGRDIGLAFQIVDDLLGVRGDPSAMGKSRDENTPSPTYPGFLGYEESQQRARTLIDSAKASIAPFGAQGDVLVSLAEYILERDH